MVIARKVWGGHRTGEGAWTQQVLASVLRTCGQQGTDALVRLERLLRSPQGITLDPGPSPPEATPRSSFMRESVTFGPRTFRSDELGLMRQVARACSGLGVTEIARTLCELLDWKRPNGKLKNHECRQLLEQLAGEGW